MKFSALLKQNFRRLSEHQALWFALLGIASGCLSAGIIVAFRFAIEGSQLLLPVAVEDYESLPLALQLILPSIGFLVIALYLHFVAGENKRVGITHVIDRINHHQGFFPLRNIVTQFITGAIAVISGQSAGREGAAVHLGAGVSSLLGGKASLNNQNMRLIVACGSAAAISASFNTPVAGVIFAMEVILLDYTISSFIPVMLASIGAAIISRSVFGDNLTFSVPAFHFQTLWELPYLLLMALIIGAASALAIKTAKQMTLLGQNWNIWQRFSLACFITLIGISLAPQIMGLGYDTVNSAMLGEMTWKILLLIAFVKIIVSSAVIGLGAPSGFIGPSLVMGACIGAAMGELGSFYSPTLHSDISFYSTLGMAAMMGTVLRAPLAALMAALEFTGNSDILLPAMLVIVVSSLICNELFKQTSVFQTLLDTQDNLLKNNRANDNSIIEWLNNTAVSQLAETRFKEHDRYILRSTAENLCKQNIKWILISDDTKPTALITVHTLAFYLRFSLAHKQDGDSEKTTIDLLSIPGEKKDLAELSSEAMLRDALNTFEKKQVSALFLVKNQGSNMFISGILLEEYLDQYFRS